MFGDFSFLEGFNFRSFVYHCCVSNVDFVAWRKVSVSRSKLGRRYCLKSVNFGVYSWVSVLPSSVLVSVL